MIFALAAASPPDGNHREGRRERRQERASDQPTAAVLLISCARHHLLHLSHHESHPRPTQESLPSPNQDIVAHNLWEEAGARNLISGPLMRLMP